MGVGDFAGQKIEVSSTVTTTNRRDVSAFKIFIMGEPMKTEKSLYDLSLALVDATKWLSTCIDDRGCYLDAGNLKLALSNFEHLARVVTDEVRRGLVDAPSTALEDLDSGSWGVIK